MSTNLDDFGPTIVKKQMDGQNMIEYINQLSYPWNELVRFVATTNTSGSADTF